MIDEIILKEMIILSQVWLDLKVLYSNQNILVLVQTSTYGPVKQNKQCVWNAGGSLESFSSRSCSVTKPHIWFKKMYMGGKSTKSVVFLRNGVEQSDICNGKKRTSVLNIIKINSSGSQSYI